FVASDAAQVGFVDGPTVRDPTRYFPTELGNRWTYNYEERLWSVNERIVPASISPPTAVGFASTFQLVSTSEVTDSRFVNQFIPHPYSANIVGSNIQGQGIYYHAWTLIAERIVLPRLRSG